MRTSNGRSLIGSRSRGCGTRPPGYLPVAAGLCVLCALALVLLPGPAAADEDGSQTVLDRWLGAQAKIETWSADVVESRELKNIAHPIVNRGQVWFEKPNRFRWQLGEPPRTIAVRKGDELLIVYPRLKRVERYAIGETVNPAWRQALALLEVGFPTDPDAFRARYDPLSVTRTEKGWRFELQPRAEAARELIERVRIDVSAENLELLATELVFPDGSTMRNDFVDRKINPKLDESLFDVDTSGYQVVSPLEQGQSQ
jgi:outer membrane lipoprotein-sorting protein